MQADFITRLYYGDCLEIMRTHMVPASVDVIYADPPLNSRDRYKRVYCEETGHQVPGDVDSFHDVWEPDERQTVALHEFPTLMQGSGLVDEATELWRRWLVALHGSNPRVLAYLAYLTERLLWMKGCLRPTGVLCIRSTPGLSHYIKAMLDAIFGGENFRKEILWAHATDQGNRVVAPVNDAILVYAASDQCRIPKVDDPSEQLVVYDDPNPVTLLERLIDASSQTGDVVLDPFCGGGPALEAASRLQRQWIGVDAAFHAIKREARVRLPENECDLVEGLPNSFSEVTRLWECNPSMFKRWAVEAVDGFLPSGSLDAFDGRIYFPVPGSDRLRSMALHVAGSGDIGFDQLQCLSRKLNDEGTPLLGLITLGQGWQMQYRQEAFTMNAGNFTVRGRPYPRVQMLDIQEVLDGRRFDTPDASGRGQWRMEI